MRDPAKVKVNNANAYKRNQAKRLKEATDYYWENREDRKRYARHRRLVVKQLTEPITTG